MAVKTNCEVNGKKYFRVSCSIGKDSNGKYIRKTFYGKSEKEAKKKMEEYLDGLKMGLSDNHRNAFLGSYMRIWLFEVVKVSSKIKPSTFERYEGIYRNYIKNSPIAPLPIYNIKSLNIQRYYNDLKEEGKSASQIFNLNKLLKSFFSYAVNEGYIIKNPCTGLVIPGKYEEPQKEVEVFSDKDLYAILNSPEDSTIKDLALLCISTGMRRGEALGLNENDFDEDNKLIHIRRTISTITFIDKEDNRTIKTISQIPKTKGSIRDIPYPTSLIPVIKHIKAKKSINKLKAGDSWNCSNDNYLFLTENGELINDSNISRAWKRFLKRCGVEYIKFHALRHTYATKQFEANIPLKTVSSLLGHSSIEVTSNIYTHVRKEQKEKSIDILNVIKM